MARAHLHDGCGVGGLVELAQALAAHGRMRPLFLGLGGHLGGRCRLRSETAPRARAVQGPVVMGGGGGRRARMRPRELTLAAITPETGVSLRKQECHFEDLLKRLSTKENATSLVRRR